MFGLLLFLQIEAQLIVHWVQALRIATAIVSGCSFLHTFLPPWDWKPDFIEVGMSEFPFIQRCFYRVFHNRYYRALIYIIGFVALNGRSTVWKFISTENADGPNATVPTIVHAANQKLDELQKK